MMRAGAFLTNPNPGQRGEIDGVECGAGFVQHGKGVAIAVAVAVVVDKIGVGIAQREGDREAGGQIEIWKCGYFP